MAWVAFEQNDPGLTIASGATKVPYVRFDPNLLALESSEAPPPTRLEPAAPSGDLPFAKAAAAWPSLPKEIPAAWQVPVALRPGRVALGGQGSTPSATF